MSLVAHIAAVVLVASVVASFTDWLFMDVLIHGYYQADPDIWRGGRSTRRILVSQIVGALASAAMTILYLWAPGRPLWIACAAFCAGPLPVIMQQWLWMRLHPAIAVSHATGWLARALITSFTASWLLPLAT